MPARIPEDGAGARRERPDHGLPDRSDGHRSVGAPPLSFDVRRVRMGVVDAEERFAALVEQFAGGPGVVVPDGSRRGFGSNALKVKGSIFAMVTRGQLVVKLPRHRVDALIASGDGSPFDTGKSPPMKEWVTVGTDEEATWLALAQEALELVGGRAPRP